VKLDETLWWAKARRHQAWDASWRAEMERMEAMIESTVDIQLLQRIIDRAGALEKRIRQLKLIMARHLERAPDLLPGLRSLTQIGGRLQ
jgi:hypothetical protein